MARTFRTFVSLLLDDPQVNDAEVHFRRGPQGYPAVCDDPRCDMPRLDAE